MQQSSTEYQVLRCPFAKAPAEMTVKEGTAYYTWFMAIKDERLLYFRKQCADFMACDISCMDYTRKSLLYAWRFFLSVSTTEDFTDDTWNKVAISSALLKQGITAQTLFKAPRQQLTYHSKMLLIDLGMYLGETFVNSFPSLRWGMHRKKDVHFNCPVIEGFVGPYNPSFHLVVEPVGKCGALACVLHKKHIPRDAELDLMRAFDDCCSYLPNSAD